MCAADHHNCKACIPGLDSESDPEGGCGKPNVLLYAGTNVPNAAKGAPIWKS